MISGETWLFFAAYCVDYVISYYVELLREVCK